MKIGDEVYVHGYVDEIRNGTIIIRNEGGYFGTALDEVMPSAQPEQPEQRWIPFKTRPLTKEEKEEHPEWDVGSHKPIKCGKEPVPEIERIE